jgi:transcriptional antiterminator Rof (Rho-off)
VTASQYDALERAIVDGSRVALRINGGELVVIPTAIQVRKGREMLITQNPSSGLPMLLNIDDIERLEVVR